MGVPMRQIDGQFFMPAAALDAALAAAQALKAREAALTGGHGFAWVRNDPWGQAPTLPALLRWWGYDTESDAAGNLSSVWFMSEKLGDELHLWNALAPFVRPGSYLTMAGDEGEQWRWWFDGARCRQQQGRTVFDDGDGDERGGTPAGGDEPGAVEGAHA